MRRMKKAFAVAAACGLCAAAVLTGCQKKEREVVIYTNADDEAIEAMKGALDGGGYEGKYILQSFGTSELGGKLLAEGANIEADMVTMSSFYLDSAQETNHMFQNLTFETKSLAEYPAFYTPITAQEGTIPVSYTHLDVYKRQDKKYDVLVFGMPQAFHYGNGMGTNPIMMMPVSYTHLSLRRVGIAVGLSCFLGIIFGVMMGWNRYFNATLGMIFEVIRPIPPLAWIPLITIWFGIGEFPKILIVFIGTFANVVVNTATGVRMVDAQQLDVGKTFGASQFNTLLHIVLPASLPAIFAGIRTALGAGWAVVLALSLIHI